MAKYKFPFFWLELLYCVYHSTLQNPLLGWKQLDAPEKRQEEKRGNLILLIMLPKKVFFCFQVQKHLNFSLLALSH
jgi:hypothetical protein